MKFERTQRFDNDFKVLPKQHQTSFRDLMLDFNAACNAYLSDPGGFVWSTRLRVTRLTSAKGIWEMT